VTSAAKLTGVGAVVNTAQVRAGSSVAIIGLGGVGLAALLGATVAGARQIVAVDLSDAKLELAKALGATHTFNAGNPGCKAEIRHGMSEMPAFILQQLRTAADCFHAGADVASQE
jgi:Zn-dependent alcohol dehydrogenase